MTDLVRSIRQLNQLGGHDIAEPFAGGAGASLSLLFRESVSEIHINDFDQSIHDFWWTLVNRPKPFLSLLGKTRVSMAEWNRQREVYKRKSNVSRLRKGFSAFYLNRCNRSGIIMNGGPIGGIRQKGEWKLNARYNKPELAKRCGRVIEHRDRIHVSQMDAIEFISGANAEQVFFLIDPPYYAKGPLLYLNKLSHDYHLRLSRQLRKQRNDAWVLTYDDCPQIRSMYEKWANIRPFSLRYAAAERRNGKEILVSPKWMEIPKTQSSKAIGW